jgi:hypothetical protein
MEHESAAPEPGKESSGRVEQAAQVQDSPVLANDYRDAAAVRAEPKNDREPTIEFYFKRHRGITVLLVIFIIMVAVAFAIYPRRAAIYRPQSFTVKVGTSTELTYVLVGVAKLSSDSFRLGIALQADAPSLPQTRILALIDLQLPGQVTAASCKAHCLSKVVSNGFFAGQSDYVMYVTTSFTRVPRASSTWQWTNEFVVDAPVFAFDENGLDVEAQLPQVQILSLLHKPVGKPTAEIVYYMQDPD